MLLLFILFLEKECYISIPTSTLGAANCQNIRRLALTGSTFKLLLKDYIIEIKEKINQRYVCLRKEGTNS